MNHIILTAWDNRQNPETFQNPELHDAINAVISDLSYGKKRIAEKKESLWIVHEAYKKAVLLAFRIWPMTYQKGRFDKVPLKWDQWDEHHFKEAGFRAVPGAIVREGSYVAPDVVLMPSFVNIGAYVDSGTMVDTWATIGSCAQIGKNCHISGGAGIGGVLEPLSARPVIIEDNCFIGARSEVAEGVIVGEGSVLSMGVFLGASTKIVDRATGHVYQGEVPPYSVVVPGVMPSSQSGPHLACAVIVKQVDEKTRSKTSINELLRQYNI
jgi:2,3,4,5-tetrahydropyridine-2-carboxylate N-succinyltransferase